MLNYQAFSQNGNYLVVNTPVSDSSTPSNLTIENKAVQQQSLTPVYFSSTRRLIIYKERKINYQLFVDMCRNINDSLIQEQILLYNTYTHQKNSLGILAFSSIAGSIGMMGLSSTITTNNGSTDNLKQMYAGVSICALVTSVVSFIATSIPHNKRKIIAFHDLAIAYNLYVEKYNNALLLNQ